MKTFIYIFIALICVGCTSKYEQIVKAHYHKPTTEICDQIPNLEVKGYAFSRYGYLDDMQKLGANVLCSTDEVINEYEECTTKELPNSHEKTYKTTCTTKKNKVIGLYKQID